MGELLLKGDDVKNPSAYIVKGVANALSGKQAPRAMKQMWMNGVAPGAALGYMGREQAMFQETLEPWRDSLDSRALDALQQIGPEEGANILNSLTNKGPEVQNPSAYILKACSNARKNEYSAAGGGPEGRGAPGCKRQ